MSENLITTTVVGITDTGLVRNNNEDCVLVADPYTGRYLGDNVQLTYPEQDNRLLLVVSDGMGGAEGGEIASRLTTYVLQTELPKMPRRLSAQSRLSAAIEEANNLIREERQLDYRLNTMGATVTAVLIENNTAYIGEVGDSRAYIMRDGRLKQLTTDQTMIQVMLDSGIISPQAAAISSNRNILLQAVGGQEYLQIAVNAIELRRKDILLLCSDGLSSKLSTNEMALSIQKGLATQPLDVVAKDLVDIAKQRGGEDNISLILAQIDGSGLKTRAQDTLTRSIKILSRFDPEQEAEPKAKLITRPATIEDWVNTAVIDYYAQTPAQRQQVAQLNNLGDYIVCRRGDLLTLGCEPTPDTIYCLASGLYRLEVELSNGSKQSAALLISPTDRRTNESIQMRMGPIPIKRLFFIGSVAPLGNKVRGGTLWCEDDENALIQVTQEVYMQLGQILGNRFLGAIRPR